MIKLTKFLIIYIRLYILEILFKLKLWLPAFEKDYDEAIENFNKINNTYWSPISTEYPQKILIEGHLSNYGINYLFRTATCALAIQEKMKYNIAVVYPSLSHKWILAQKTYKSFNITASYFLGNYPLINIYFIILSKLHFFYFKKKIKKPEDIIKLKFKDIVVGDLIYDDIIKLKDLKSIEKIDNSIINSVAWSYYYYLQYNYFFSKHNFKYYVSTHSAYSEYGLLIRVALKKNIKVIETTDIQTNYYSTINDQELPTYHQGIKNLIHKEFNCTNRITKSEIDDAYQKLSDRMNSKIDQIDIKRAYKGKEYHKEELAHRFDFDKEKKIIFILTHIFIDSPHTSSWMLYNDYYVWLVETLKICSQIKDINWVVKPHPASALYKEDGVVEELIKELNASNVVLCPNDLNTRSLVNCASAIVTVHGTAGLEFACFGVPVIITGRPFYSGYNFTIEPNSESEYIEELKRLKYVPKLPIESVESALQILTIWNKQFDWYNPIITTEVLSNVWGSDKEPDPYKAYEIVTDNIKNNNPRDLKMWELTKYYISND